MFEDCPFNYGIAKTKLMYYLITTKHKFKFPILFSNIFHLFLILSYVFKHRKDKFDTLIIPIYIAIIWISIIVSFIAKNSYKKKNLN